MKSKSFASYRFMLSLGTFVVLLFLCGSAFGQGQGNTAIRGAIKDQAGAVVAGATVTLTNPETNFTRTTTSNDSGQFAFEGLQPGVYNVEVEAKGFKKAALNQVAALVSKPTDLPVEGPSKVELLVNLQAAKGLGIEMPLSLLVRADELFE